MKIRIFVIISIFFLIFNVISCGSTQSFNSVPNKDLPALKDIYKDYFLIGNIINGVYMKGEYIELITKHFNTVTCENSMKPSDLAPRQRGGQYNFSGADQMLNLMSSNNILVHGHTLVWHSQTPAWMFEGTPEQVKQNMVNHINTVLAHYKGKVFSWDVVNEAIRDGINPGEQNADWKTQLRTGSGWYKAMGPEYIELAFRTARAADPNVKLYYNDYSMNNLRKSQVAANMIKDINERYRAEGNNRNLIDGIGFQGHYGLTTSVQNVRESLDKFVQLGVEIAISELDIEVRSVGSGNFGIGKDSVIPEAVQRTQALVYAQFFNLFKEYKDSIVRVTMWGLTDELSWKSLGNPCLWDGDVRAKQAFFAVADPDRTLRISR